MDALTICSDENDNLIISEDTSRYDDGPEGGSPVAVFLYTPHMSNKMDHHHIEMTVEEVEKLHKWCGQFLKKHKP